MYKMDCAAIESQKGRELACVLERLPLQNTNTRDDTDHTYLALR